MRLFVSKAFLFAVVLLVGTEVGARVFFGRRFSGRFEYGYNPDSGFRDLKDGSVKLVRAGGRRFFPQQFDRIPQKGVCRIMVVGDSVPRGPSVSESYASRVAANLTQDGIPCEGWNLCLPGNGVRRNQIVLKRALQYRPDVVILHLNDSNEFEDEREWLRAQQARSPTPENWIRKSVIVAGVHEAKTEQAYWKWIPEQIRLRNMATDADAKVKTLLAGDKAEEWRGRVKTVFQESVALAKASGAFVLIVSQARTSGGASQGLALSDEGLDDLAVSLKAEGVGHISMKKTFLSLPFQDFFQDASHLNSMGHQILAEEIRNMLTSSACSVIRLECRSQLRR